jgi:hypothetical protein
MQLAKKLPALKEPKDCEISGSHGSEYEGGCPLGCCAM